MAAIQLLCALIFSDDCCTIVGLCCIELTFMIPSKFTWRVNCNGRMMGKILFIVDESDVPSITSVTRCYDVVVFVYSD